MKRLIKSTTILICAISILFSQTRDSAVLYQEAINTIDAEKALKIYDQIISSKNQSDYYWLSILKKAEINYAIGSYISASDLFKEFNINAPKHLVSDISKDLLFKSFNASGQLDSLKFYQKRLTSPSLSPKKSIKKNKIWFLQFGAYSNKESANILQETLIEDGISDIQVSQVMNRGKMIYYVRSSNFKSYTIAEKQAKKLRKKDIEFIISGY